MVCTRWVRHLVASSVCTPSVSFPETQWTLTETLLRRRNRESLCLVRPCGRPCPCPVNLTPFYPSRLLCGVSSHHVRFRSSLWEGPVLPCLYQVCLSVGPPSVGVTTTTYCRHLPNLCPLLFSFFIFYFIPFNWIGTMSVF